MTTLLPIEDWRRIIGLHPFYFYNLTTSSVEPVYPNNKPSSICLSYVKKYAWQGADYLGRADIEQAIETAEKKLQSYLGYAIAPQYAETSVLWPRYYDTTRTRHANWDTSGRYISVGLPFGNGHVQALGIESLTSIGTVTVAGGTLVYADTDGDGLYDTFTITISTTVTDPTKLAVYFASGDRLDSEPVSEKWRIRPVTVSISGGTATIKGRYWLLARPILYEGVLTQPLDPQTAGNFVTSLLVYERTTDPTGTTVATAQGNVIWETEPCHGWWCCCSSCCGSGPSYVDNASTDPASYGVAVARVGLRDAVTGRVTVGESLYNSSTGFWYSTGWGACREPDRAIVRHYSGYPLENGQVAQKFQTIVARLACAEMTRPICACEPANKLVWEWSFDLARTGGTNDERFAISEQDLNNPFGTKRGQVYAWREVRNLRIAIGLIDH